MPSFKTYGLTHIALAVKDAERSAGFYQQIFGMQKVFQRKGFVQLQTPGSHDAIVLDESLEKKGEAGGIAHFGFRLAHPNDIHTAIESIQLAGGQVIEQGAFSPGEPYVFFSDPDGYEIEIWYEP
jgi:catechol 2,3-dioxygenase-like lactoylglutathione lyase family enzyme